MFDLSGKTVLVTGGSRGIGAAMARAIAAAGGRLLLHYNRNAAAAEALQKEIGHEACQLIQADLAEADVPTALWRAAAEAAPRIDVLINNAGISVSTKVDTPRESWNRVWAEVMQVNLHAPAELCKLAIPHFREHGGGKIINVASRSGQRGDFSNDWPYAASKGGLIALTKTIARSFGGENILAFVIAPGFTVTDMGLDGLDEASHKRIIAEIPLGAMATPEECGALAAFLCADVVRHLTGATFDINGASYLR